MFERLCIKTLSNKNKEEYLILNCLWIKFYFLIFWYNT
jgi:hypothetical protein